MTCMLKSYHCERCFKPIKGPKYITSCQHNYHITCLVLMALDKEDKCPVCKNYLDMSCLYTQSGGLTKFACDEICKMVDPSGWILKRMISKISNHSFSQRKNVYLEVTKILASIHSHREIHDGICNLVIDLNRLTDDETKYPKPSAPPLPDTYS